MIEPVYLNKPVFCFTSDVDWASEAALAIQQEIYDNFSIKPTYFVTHKSAQIETWKQEKKIETGLHPNFLPGSSHGESFEQVIDTVFEFVPDAISFRAHRCFDVTPVTHMLYQRGIRFDSNIVTNLQRNISPIEHESGLLRFPVFYEDGTHFEWRRSWELTRFEQVFASPGLKVISAHPMITSLNVQTPEYWHELKDKFPPNKWVSMSLEEINQFKASGKGPQKFLIEVIQFAQKYNFPIMTLSELYRTVVDSK